MLRRDRWVPCLLLGLAVLTPALAGCESSVASTPAPVQSPPPSSTHPVQTTLGPRSPSAEPLATPSLPRPTAPVATFTDVYSVRCSPAQLRLGWAGGWSEPTGQHTLGLKLTNVATSGCYLFGYPGVSLVDDAGSVLPFQYVRGGDQVVTTERPRHVDVPPGGTAYLTVNKYRCDTHDLMDATAARVIPPDDSGTLRVSITGNVPIDYCGAGDPGSTVYVSPVEPTSVATIRL